MDDDLRGKERAARDGAPAERAELLAARVRAGRLEPWRLRLAARLGDPAARLACPDIATAPDVQTLCRALEADGATDEAWARLLISFTTVLAKADPGKIFDVLHHAERLVAHGGPAGADDAIELIADAYRTAARPCAELAIDLAETGAFMRIPVRDLLEDAAREVAPWSTGQADPVRERNPPPPADHEDLEAEEVPDGVGEP